MDEEFDVEMQDVNDDELLDYDDSDIAVPVPVLRPSSNSIEQEQASAAPLLVSGTGHNKVHDLDDQEQEHQPPAVGFGGGLNVNPPVFPDNQIPNQVREADMDSGYSATPPTPAPNNNINNNNNNDDEIGDHGIPEGLETRTSIFEDEDDEDLDELCLDIEDSDVITIDTATAKTDDGLENPDNIVYITPVHIIDNIKGLKSLTETDSKTRIRYYLNPYIAPASTLEPEKVATRALRFGISSSESESELKMNATNNFVGEKQEVIYKKPADELLCDLYQSLKLYDNPAQSPTLENVSKQFRLDGVLIRGTRAMSSNEIFQYLRNHEQLPLKMEWINDSQCIAIFNDHYEAGRALLDMSKPIGEASDETADAIPGDMNINYDFCDTIPVNAVEVAMPLSHTWRYAVPCAQAKGILMTIARKSDKKQEHAEQASEFYRKHGNPNKEQQGIFTPKGYHKRFAPKEEPPRPAKIGRFDRSRLGVKGKETKRTVELEDLEDTSDDNRSPSQSYQEFQKHKRTHMDAFEKPKRTIIIPKDDDDDEVVEIPDKLRKLKYGGMVADIEEEIIKKRGPRILKVGISAPSSSSSSFNPNDYDPFLDEGKEPPPSRYEGSASRTQSERRVTIKERLGHSRRHY